MYFFSENTYGVINLNYNRIAILPLLGVLVLILIELICAFQLALLLKNNKYNVFLCKKSIYHPKSIRRFFCCCRLRYRVFNLPVSTLVIHILQKKIHVFVFFNLLIYSEHSVNLLLRGGATSISSTFQHHRQVPGCQT